LTDRKKWCHYNNSCNK